MFSAYKIMLKNYRWLSYEHPFYMTSNNDTVNLLAGKDICINPSDVIIHYLIFHMNKNHRSEFDHDNY